MEPVKVNLCSFCSELVKFRVGTADLPLTLPHHSTFGVLLCSSKTCRLCHTIASLWDFREDHLTLFLSEMNPLNNTREAFSVTITVIAARLMFSGVCWTFVEASFRSNNTPLNITSKFTLVACQAGCSVSAHPIWKTSATDFNEKVSVIRSWLQECRSHDANGHRECRPVPFTPKRLVRVGLDGTPPRLVQGWPRKGKMEYATVSHCWGSALPLQTTRETLHQFAEKIPPDILPKTFADAIQIAHDLGISHIWIDALCIVQDDEEEWQSEAAHMDSIYQGGQLTISAVQSSDSTGGCFPSMDDGFRDGEMLFCTCYDDADGPSLLVRVYCGDIRNRAANGTALSIRGWTLQEQLLSPRLVSCMQPEVHWTCQRCHLTESGLHFNPTEMLNSDWGLWISRTSTDSTLQPHDERTRKMWRLIIEDYSSRSFTFPGDRVAAMAGITRYIAAQMRDESILGLWKGSFSQDLAWLRISKEPAREFSSLTSLMPSWSWLACPGQVAYDFWGWENWSRVGVDQELNDHVKLLDWNVQWDGEQYTSAVKSAYVRIESSVREIQITPFAEGAVSNPPYFQVFEEDLRFSKKTAIPWRCAGQFDIKRVDESTTYLCLLVRSRTRNGNTSAFRVDEMFLILESVGVPEDMKYRRVGLAMISGESRTFDASRKVSILLV